MRGPLNKPLMGFGDPGNVVYVWEQNMVIINWWFVFFFFRLFFLCSLFKPLVKREKSNKGEAVARGRAPSQGGCRAPGSLWGGVALASKSISVQLT